MIKKILYLKNKKRKTRMPTRTHPITSQIKKWKTRQKTLKRSQIMKANYLYPQSKSYLVMINSRGSVRTKRRPLNPN